MTVLQPYMQKSATVTLDSGYHNINIFYFQGPPVMVGLTLEWQGPANEGLGCLSTVPASAFWHQNH